MRIGNKNPIYIEHNFTTFQKYFRYHLGTHKNINCLILIDAFINDNYLDEVKSIINNSNFKYIEIIYYNSDENIKTIFEIIKIWDILDKNNFNRDDLVICVGGGTISDLGGFAASTFKRGLKVINIPTTLLSAVDAGIGGKNGINFNNNKNEIGTYYFPLFTFIYPEFLNTLSEIDILSGYGEIIKYGLLINKESVNEIIKSDPRQVSSTQIIRKSIQYKHHIINIDPLEKNRRKILNLGHTFGHAFESYRLSQNVQTPHGICVAWGLQYSLKFSEKVLNFSPYWSQKVIDWLQKWYDKPLVIDFDELLTFLIHDKKNLDEKISFVLLYEIGKPKIHKFTIEEIKQLYSSIFF
ncbi:MAG: 3-dehydroquinate synthase family protein [Bacteroidales bacterium]|nr:3-dehydroquinate synthase family protein [Bacteroidales bacterium]